MRISSYVPARDTGGAGLHRGGTGIEKTYVFTGPGAFTVNDDRATIPPWGINGGRHGGCSTKTLIRVTGEVVELASKIDQVPVAAGDTLVFRTAGAGGWGDPLERDPELVLRDVLRDLVSHEAARRDYGVVIDGDGRRQPPPPRPSRRDCGTSAGRSSHSTSDTPPQENPHDDQSSFPPHAAGRGRRPRRARRPHGEDRRARRHRGALPRRLRAAAHHFGLPDVGLVGRAEVVESVRRMRAATDMPIVVDADTGYGSEAGVWLTVRELEAVGANAVQIEDQVSPKRCGHMEGKEVIPAGEMVIKVRAAVAARRSEETLIIARSDALQVNGLDDAIERCNAYGDAGADLIFVDAPPTVEDYALDRRALLRARCREHVGDRAVARDPDRRAGGDGVQARHLPEHTDLALHEGVRRAVRGGRP